MSIDDRNRIAELERRVTALEVALSTRVDPVAMAVTERMLTQVVGQQTKEVHKQVRDALKVRRG